MIRAALFDVDGTLVDSNGAHAAAWHDALAESGFAVPVERIRPLIGMGGDRILPALVPGLSDGTEPGKSIGERRKAIFLERYVDRLQATRGARELLSTLRERGVLCTVATSAKRDELGRILARGDLAPFFMEAATSDDASASKPAPDIVVAALQRVPVPAREAVLIGDTRYDVEAARAAGVTPIALLCGGADPRTLREAAAIYADPAELLADIERSPLAA